MNEEQVSRTASEAGWHVSRYNLFAVVPGTNDVAFVNLFKRSVGVCSPIEGYLISVLDKIDENHPIIERLAHRGLIANFDERAVLEARSRVECAQPAHDAVWFTICTTMACNFDCPYCFEDRRRGKMTAEVQDDVVALAGRMLDASGAKMLIVTWYGGEPLLAPDVIESLSERFMALTKERGAKYNANIVTNGYLLTPDIASMLGRCEVSSAQVTIDGIGATHDETRRLVGGGGTYQRIIENLSRPGLPLHVNVRANIHEGNISQVDELRDALHEIAEESGNSISFYPKPVLSSDVADKRGEQVGLLNDMHELALSMRVDARQVRVGEDHDCAALTLWSLLIDELGNLHKCAGLTAGNPQYAYGNAHDWDPADPFATASNPDNIAKYLNCGDPVPDEECRECVWLPVCGGGCPHYRLLGKRKCVPYRDNPERYVLTRYERILAKTQGKGQNDA